MAILLGYFGLGVYMNLSHMEFSEVHIDEPIGSPNYGAALRAIRESERIYYQKVYFRGAVVVIIYSLIHFLLAWKAWASCRANPEKWSDYSYKMVAPYVLQGLVIVSFIELLIIAGMTKHRAEWVDSYSEVFAAAVYCSKDIVHVIKSQARRNFR